MSTHSTNIDAVRGTLYVAAIKLQASLESSRVLLEAHDRASRAVPDAAAGPGVGQGSPINAMLFVYCRAGLLDRALALAAERVRG